VTAPESSPAPRAIDPHLLERYGSAAGAAAYRRKYERSLFRRLSHRREMAIVAAALGDAGAGGRVLDCPCGAGRLVPTILRSADRVVAVDLSEAMVREAREALAPLVEAGRVEFAVASADALPFPDGSFDAAVCHRLLHHLRTPEARGAVLRELARVARRGVVASFADASTAKARRQKRRGRDGRRTALSPEEFIAEARAAGLEPAGKIRRLWGPASLVAVAPFVPRPAR
jgi:ubiquinone/menaquinone biosynthesis C-methylase UbiE